MKNTSLIPVYLKKIPAYGSGRFNVNAYSDPQCSDLKGIFEWWMSNIPTKRNKYVTLNCWKWQAVWINA